MREKIDFYIGIDPGVQNGFAVWDVKKKEIVYMFTFYFWDLIDTLKEYKEKNVCVILEDPNLNKPIFIKTVKEAGNIIKKYQRIAQNVGSNKGYATLIREFLEKEDINHRTIKPSSKKWDKEDLKKITGIKKRTSQHIRDAVKLIYGL